jgi:hypothetical protein
MANLTHVVKRDEIGKLIEFTLSDVDGTVDLTNYTVTMTLKKGSTVATSAASVVKRNQETNKGECYHTWTANTIPDKKGTYKGELKLVNGPNILYWPCNKDGEKTYFTVIVQDPLG